MISKFKPTPIMESRLGEQKNAIYVKRDDLLPFCFGGNKVRIARELMNDMLSKGKNYLIGYGNARSNLVRVLANYCGQLGLECTMISPDDDDGSRIETYNSKLSKMCGVNFVFCSKQNVAETVERVLVDCEKKGFRPYYIYGDKFGKGNEQVPLQAYNQVYDEIMTQEEDMGLKFDYIFLPTGTGMTQSGLLSRQIQTKDWQRTIVGITVARHKQQLEDTIGKTLSDFFKEQMNSEYLLRIPECITIYEDLSNFGYGVCSEHTGDVIRTVYEKDGIPLDPTYSGKGFCGMLKWLQENEITDKRVLFIHTGGTPLFFDYISKMP